MPFNPHNFHFLIGTNLAKILNVKWYCILIVAILISISCGKPEIPNSNSMIKSEQAVSSATNAQLEERDADGHLLWIISSQRIEEKADIINCDSVQMNVTSLGAASFSHGSGSGAMNAYAKRGEIIQGTDTKIVKLFGNVHITMENGWQAEGAAMEWDGRIVRIDSNVIIYRTGMVIHGNRAIIELNRNHFTLMNAKGQFEGVKM